MQVAEGRGALLVDKWTGETATQLQSALRLTNEAFARRLEVGVRTVAAWHERPGTVPRPDIQRALDDALAAAGPAVGKRFALMLDDVPAPLAVGPPAVSAQVMRTAIAIVIRDQDVLLVGRRTADACAWQFPAGFVKPESTAEVAAVRETLAETGVRCRVVEYIGNRVHPYTGVFAEYVRCEYLTGEAANLDPAENVDVVWAPCAKYADFMPADRIYEPVRTILEEIGGVSA